MESLIQESNLAFNPDTVPAIHMLTQPQYSERIRDQGPVLQSIDSLTSSLMVKMLNVLVSTVFNSQVFLLIKCESLLQMQKLLTFFSKNISIYAIFNDESFNTLTNDIVSFE